MQENVKKIKEAFPDVQINTEGETSKIHLQELTAADVCNLHELIDEFPLMKVKRSGTGLTVIFKS